MDKKVSYPLRARVLFIIYAVLCLLIFSCMRFPYHIVKPKVEGALSRALHADVAVGDIAGHFPFGLVLEDLRVDGESVAPRVTVRPALTSLLLGRLGLMFAIDQARGRLDCSIKTSFKHPGDPLALDFKLKEFDIAPFKKLIQGGLEIAGTVTGEGWLATESSNFKDSQGNIELTCKNGQIPLNLPSLPLGAVTFADLTFKAEMDQGRLEIKQMQLSGNDVSGTLSGNVRLGMNIMTSELDLGGNLKLSQAYRLILGNPRGDALRFRLQGTLGRPRLLPQ